MQHLPVYVPVTFILTLLVTIWLFSKAARYSKALIAVVGLVVVVQSSLGFAGFYRDSDSATTRFPLLVAPSMLLLFSLFILPKGRVFIDSLDVKILTILHTIRIGVELVLFWLFINHAVPKAMTFEGRNLDILSGLTAPAVYYFGFVKRKLGRKAMIVWNIACIILLLNVVSAAFLSLPGRFENFGFEQPLIAVGYFPYLLLPSVLVPLVLFSNAVSIRQLIMNRQSAF